MGKWLDRVVKGSEDDEIFSHDIPKASTDNVDTLAELPSCLTEQGQEVYKEFIGEMLSPKYGPTLTLEEAQHLAMEKVSCFPGNLRENIKE